MRLSLQADEESAAVEPQGDEPCEQQGGTGIGGGQGVRGQEGAPQPAAQAFRKGGQVEEVGEEVKRSEERMKK